MSEVEKKKQEYDYLTEDPPISGQKWVCLSFLSPEDENKNFKNSKIRGIKVRGVFADYDEAKAYAEKLRDTVDGKFHIFVGEVGKWLPWDPNPETAKDEVYAEKELNSLMKSYKENQEKAKKLYEMRKDELVQKTLREQEQRKNKEEKRKKKNKKPKVIITDEKQIKEQEQEVKQTEEVIKVEQTSLKEDKTQLMETKQNVSKLDVELQKLQKEYEEATK